MGIFALRVKLRDTKRLLLKGILQMKRGDGYHDVLMMLHAARTYHTKLKGMLRPIFCININTHSDRK